MKNEAPVFSLWIDITQWILDRIDDFPKKVRFSISNRVANLSVDILELIIEALYKRKKILLLREINIKIEKLRVLLRICFNKKYLSVKQYEFIQEKLFESGKMIGGWIKQRSKDERTV
ncbi:MAG: diversity-generating retroelement protein Avd [Candidatus Aminicenantes bacterium]|nr:diversity-generating retroelement protein Avd [Candidatus Aminicenantes bacterium]NIM82123.1 diversity-generating retroelement protein Avd [Candidatus Aminicenantes bacterium]NIN21516.1 diversity-generating retroelement protein Avd [Candidatus Aminicenantes bacterium]NIN45327.1 diversity-generating retroelement protein Avd [Candidatus Aminicenantes bacterium]NIN88147.1 diversity-generating retroelement protein Avd [Candidatus Aminicenantes bacterium]